MKPTYGAVSRYGLVAFASSLDQVGPLTRTVRDNALVLNALAGKDSRDATSLDRDWVDFTAQLDGQDALTVQESELSEAGWYRREEIPAADTTISIGQEMIERFRLGEL